MAGMKKMPPMAKGKNPFAAGGKKMAPMKGMAAKLKGKPV